MTQQSSVAFKKYISLSKTRLAYIDYDTVVIDHLFNINSVSNRVQESWLTLGDIFAFLDQLVPPRVSETEETQ